MQRNFFVSYTQADRAWAEWLAWELEAAGYTTMLQAWDMPPGTAFAHLMDQALQTCHRIILVLSPKYLRSAMGEAEWRVAFLDDPSGEQRKLLPVRVEPCEPKGLLADRVWIDLAGMDEATARTVLREGVAHALRGHGRPDSRPQFPRRSPPAALDRPRFPTALPPVWNVPFLRNPTFTGRDRDLTELAGRLERGEAAAVSQVLQGGGGVGKTAVAVEYAWRYRAGFQVVWWVRAQEPATLVGDYADLATAIGLNEAAEADQQLTVAEVRNWLERHDRWLLVLDNAEAPDGPSGLVPPLARVVDLLPRVVHGQVLITSRDATWDRYASLTDLEVFTPAEAITFLLARSGSADEKTAAEIAELLGFLPLALEQAGAYVHETRIALSAYLERLRRFPAVTLEKGLARDRDPADTLATTWEVSLDRVRPTPGAVALLEVCAFLAPEEAPRDLFTQPLDPPIEELQVLATDPFTLDHAVASLHRFGLIKATTEALTVHRLLQHVVRDHLGPGAGAVRAETAVRLLAATFPTGSSSAPGLWPLCAVLLPHALAVTMYAEQFHVEPGETSELLDNVADYLHGRARYAEARTLLERALNIREVHVGPDHPATAQSLTNLAKALTDQGDLDQAQALHERALTIREARLGVDHPDTAWSLSNLAIVLHIKGDLDRARTLHERALAIYEAHMGADDLNTAWSLNDLAFVLHDQGDIDRARKLLERALAIRETRLGVDHPDTAWSLTNLATVLQTQGDLHRARALLERALAIYEPSLGTDHPNTAWSLSNLAMALHAEGDLDRACTLHERALAIYEVHMGANHPNTAWSLTNLATVVHDQGDTDRARKLLERALAIRETRLGVDHRDTTQTRDKLAAVLLGLRSGNGLD